MVVNYRTLKLTIEKNVVSMVAESLPIIFVLYFDYLVPYFFEIKINKIELSETDNIVAHLWTKLFYFICFMSLAKVFADPT